MAGPRLFDRDDARRLRADGWTWRQLADRFGVSQSGMRKALASPEARQRETDRQRRRRTGICEDCGGEAMRLVASKAKHNPDGRVLCNACRGITKRRHGWARYQAGCHCDICRAASAAHKRRQRARHAEHYRAYAREYRRRRKVAA